MEDAGIKVEEGGSATLGGIVYLLGLLQLPGIVCNVLIYFVSKDKYTRFHALQALLASLTFGCLMFVEFVIAVALLITVIGYFAMILVMIATILCMLVLLIYMAINAFQGKAMMLPLVGKIARDHVA